MKTHLLSLALLLTFGTYALYKHDANADSIADIRVSGDTSSSNRMLPTAQNTHYRDGQYTGDSINAYYGKIKTAVSIENGRITDIQILDYPRGQQNSDRLNEEALPQLTQEVIAVQSAHIDKVTGASLTSAAFMVSLSKALKNASLN